MCMCVYVSICVCVCVYVQVYACVLACVYVCVSLCVGAWMYVYVRVRVRVRVRVCIHVCVSVYMCTHSCVCVCVCVCRIIIYVFHYERYLPFCFDSTILRNRSLDSLDISISGFTGIKTSYLYPWVGVNLNLCRGWLIRVAYMHRIMPLYCLCTLDSAHYASYSV